MADELTEQFNKAAEDIKNLKARPTDEELLEMYALFKQATVGDCNTPKPGMFALKEKAKWEMWNRKKGMSQQEAKSAYISRAKTLVDTYDLN
ncbi:Acyl-CoA-binding protein [Fragariocoptes setiger]|uniref:Acyl-CoA-binding protein n=1 Tax=Fragariocoptes setiger TaxID=1670756 RepID=A0ABQ7S642_9ACAR|nr:Acyl-CoA-binding protein [Fragariocoptes setiger]